MRALVKSFMIVLACLCVVSAMSVSAGCGSSEQQSTSAQDVEAKSGGATIEETTAPAETDEPQEGTATVTATLTYIEGRERNTREVPYLPAGKKVAILETTKGIIKIELWEDKAPNTIVNFVSLANAGRYDGVEFHRVIDGFMAQTGDVEMKGGVGGPGYSIPAEFNADLTHQRGVVSMARSRDPDSAGSQFFIMLGNASHLDGQYTAFGKVIEGMDVVDSIKKGDKAQNGTVVDPDTIEKLRIESVSEE